MNEEIPTHLRSTIRLVEKAYPQGVPQGDYLALLFVLSEHLCEENLAIAAAIWCPGDGSRLNDVLAAKNQRPPCDSVIEKLTGAGLQEWLSEEEE
jgi:hypothetical protein